jgi:hypothetical protein
MLFRHTQHPRRRCHVAVELGGVALSFPAGFLKQSMVVLSDAAKSGDGSVYSTAGRAEVRYHWLKPPHIAGSRVPPNWVCLEQDAKADH